MTRTTRPTARFLVLVSLLLGVSLAAAAYSHVRIVNLSWVQGNVVVRPATGEVVHGQLNLPLAHDTVLETPQGVAEVEFEEETFARLASGSRLHLAELGLEDSGARVTELRLEQGTATFDVRPDREDSFLVEAADVQVRARRRALFRVDLTAGGSRLRVFEGAVEVQTSAGTLTVAEGQMLTWETAARNFELARNPAPDSWDEWNQSRERVASVLHYRPAPVWSPGWMNYGYPCQPSGWNLYNPYSSPYSYGSLYSYRYSSAAWYPWSGYAGGFSNFSSFGCGSSPWLMWGGWWPTPTRINPADPPPHRPPGTRPSGGTRDKDSDEGEGKRSGSFRGGKGLLPLLEFHPPELPPRPDASTPQPAATPPEEQPGATRGGKRRSPSDEPVRVRPSRQENRSKDSASRSAGSAAQSRSAGAPRMQSRAPQMSPRPSRPSTSRPSRPRS